MLPKLSIVIVHWNGIELLRNCLTSISEHVLPTLEDCEVIVVFNGSTDGSQEMCQQQFPWVRQIPNNANFGFSAGNNQGIRASRGEYILLLNNDTIVLPDTIQKLVSYLDMHPDVGIVGPKLLNPDGSLQRSCSHFPSLWRLLGNALFLHKLFPRTRVFGGSGMTYWDYSDTRHVDWLMGACMLVRKRVFDEVGLLDVSSKVAGDYEFCWRVWKAGWKVVFVHDAEIIHIGGKSSINADGPDAIMRRAGTMFANYEAMYFFFRKHHGKAHAVLAAYIRKLAALNSMIAIAPLLVIRRNPSLLARFYGSKRILTTPVRSLEDKWQEIVGR